MQHSIRMEHSPGHQPLEKIVVVANSTKQNPKEHLMNQLLQQIILYVFSFMLLSHLLYFNRLRLQIPTQQEDGTKPEKSKPKADTAAVNVPAASEPTGELEFVFHLMMSMIILV